ncbi:hypothetical protein JCM10296v2_002958 [Rhodotorula toruloides]
MGEDVMVGDGAEAGLPPGRRRGSDAVAPSRRSSTDSEPGTDDATSAMTSSSDSVSLVASLAPSSMSTVRTKLFESDDEDDDEEPDDRDVSFFTPSTPASLTTSPLSRKSSISKTAKSDPLLAPITTPILSFKVSPQGHWIPAPAAPVTECVSSELDLPDVVKSTSSLSTPPSSPPRASSSPPSSRPSLLTKSLRSLSRLPNLTLPRFSSPDSYIPAALLPSAAADLANLPPGWGPAERRRVLAAEPSHAADEARGFSISLRRRKEPFLRAPPPSPVDEVEAAGMLWGVEELDLREKDKGQSTAAKVAGEDAPPVQTANPTDDIAPLPPSSTAPSVAPAAATTPTDGSAPASAASPPQPVPRFISNHRHLLMLSLEFEMMRHAKIRGPLRQRALIVRQASPPRKDGTAPAREGSKLRQERSPSSAPSPTASPHPTSSLSPPAAAKAGITMLKDGNIGEKPRSSISDLIDILCLERYEEDSYEGLAELVESINLQPHTGPAEASRAIRKKLKYSNIHGQLRALTILKTIVENGGSRFQTTFANDRLVERIKVMAGDPHTDPKVKKKLMQVLGSWYVQFKDDPKMQLVAGLYKSCGGGKTQPTRSAATDAYEAQQARYERESALRAERKEAERRAREEEKARKEAEQAKKAAAMRSATAQGGANRRRVKFNFEQEKPKIMAAVGQGTQSAQALVNALQRVNREKESVQENLRVQDCLEKAKADRKALIRYIQLIDNDSEGDYIGTLIATNEQIINAVQMYDRMSKPVELDSDDEAIEEAKRLAVQQGLTVPPSATPKDHDDTQSIRSRLSAFDMQDREMDKLQQRQRRRLERHLSSRSGVPQVHPDLQDLAFGPTGSSSLPPPIQPRSPEDAYTHGSLSDYSDYSSEEDHSDDDAPSHPAHASGSGTTPARSYAQYVRQEDERTGTGTGLLDPSAQEDPFADPFADQEGDDASAYEVMTPGIHDKRQEWREI